jgi:S-(hydroxymethyl)glutathione dehydrogenase/alcohol dehydrogenase
VVQQVRDLTNGGVHHSFEVLGRKENREQAFAMLAPGGTATIVGMIPFGQKIELHGFDFLRERRSRARRWARTISASTCRAWSNSTCAASCIWRLDLGQAEALEINEGFASMKAGKTLRSVIMFDS